MPSLRARAQVSELSHYNSTRSRFRLHRGEGVVKSATMMSLGQWTVKATCRTTHTVQHDHVYLRQLEEQVLLDMPIHPSVISTGGSVIYSPKVMARLAETSIVVFLSARLDTVEYRISLAPDRGIASSKEQTLADIYGERVPLYEHWAKVTIAVDDATPEALVDQLVSHLDAIAR